MALNKPYGVPMQDSQGAGVPSIVDVLEDLREHYDLPQLDHVLGLSRNQSGIIVLTKNAVAKEKFVRSARGVRSHKDINHEFVCVCLGEPKFETEVTKVRYKREDINGRHQAVLLTHYHKHMKTAQMSSVNFKADVLATSPLETSPKVSLVGITCDGGKKECLEMYMAELLSPILGDHIYSHRVITLAGEPVKHDEKAAIRGPQVIPTEVRQKLKIGKQDDQVPLHLHRSGLVITRFPHKKSEPFLIEAPLPDHLANTIEKLELLPKDQDADEHYQEEHSE